MRDFLPDQVRKRNYVIGVIKEVYEKYGFEPLETPSIENLSTLTNKYGEEGDQLMYKILKRGEKLKKQLCREDEVKENDLADLALRYDLTVPLARVVANYKNELPRFFKRYQIQPVWRADRPAKGRYREFYQCDVDVMGSKSMLVETDLLTAVCEILEGLGFDDFEIRLNHRKFLDGVMEHMGLRDQSKTNSMVAIDKLDKIGFDGVKKELLDRGISAEKSEKLIHFLRFSKDFPRQIEEKIEATDKTLLNRKNEAINKSWLDGSETYVKQSETGLSGLEDMKRVIELVDQNRSRNFLRFDPSLARGLSYYTGAIFEVVLTDGDFSGSIAGGGRYDGLIGMFGKEEIPAVGLSLGLERILYVMEERGMFPDDLKTNAADVLVTLWNEETAGESLKLASELRQKGLRVSLYPQADKLGKQFKYANQIDVKYVCVLGDDELEHNKVQLKDMETGDQQLVDREDIFDSIVV